MSSDHLSAYLMNRDLIARLDDTTLLSKQEEIISFFGGFRETLRLCMKQMNTLDLIQQRRLSSLLNTFKKEQDKNNESDTTNDAPLSLLNLHDIAISMVFTYLKTAEHASLQRACRSLTVIGRKRESYLIVIDADKPINIHIGDRLCVEHKLASLNILDKLQSDNEEKVEHAVRAVLRLNNELDSNLDQLIHSGIISLFLQVCLSGESRPKPYQLELMAFISRYVLNFDNVQSAMRFGLLSFCKRMLQNKSGVKSAMCILFFMAGGLETPGLVLNRAKFFPLIASNLANITACTGTTMTYFELVHVFGVLNVLLSSERFHWHETINRPGLEYVSGHGLRQMAELFLVSEHPHRSLRSKEIVMHEIIELYVLLRERGFETQFDIHALLQQCSDQDLDRAVGTLLDGQRIHLLLDPDISALVQECEPEQCFEMYLRCMRQLPASPKRGPCLKQIRSRVCEGDADDIDALSIFAWARCDQPETWDLYLFVEFLTFLRDHLKNLASASSGKRAFQRQCSRYFEECLFGNEHFEDFILDALKCNKPLAINALRKMMMVFEESVHFVMDDRFGIYADVIKSSFLQPDLPAMRLCLVLCWANQDLRDDYMLKLIRRGVVYALQYYAHRHKKHKRHTKIVGYAVDMIAYLADEHGDAVMSQISFPKSKLMLQRKQEDKPRVLISESNVNHPSSVDEDEETSSSSSDSDDSDSDSNAA